LGFAYTFEKDRPKGLLKGKRVVIINTTGGSLKLYQSSGMFESIRQTIDGGIFRFCAMEIVEHRFFTGVSTSTEDDRRVMLEEVRNIVRSL
jgi:NAD(P)H dehydrogenase (quinone)